MTVLAVLEDRALLDAVAGILRGAAPEAELLNFSSSLQALAAARGKEIDIVVIH